MTLDELYNKAALIRAYTLRMLQRSGFSYMGSMMSVVDILVALYYGDLGGEPVVSAQDYVILGKSHTALVQYAILADLGFFHESELEYPGKPGSMLQSRPSVKVPGIRAGAIMPGQGLSIATGLAMAIQMERKQNRVFAVLGDGELQCGQVWEAALSAAHYKLHNLVVLVDHNKLQHDGLVRGIVDMNSIHSKFDSFGWKVFQVSDGNDIDELLDGIAKALTVMRQPVCLICHTVSGKGVPFAEGKPTYHAAPVSTSEIEEIFSNFTHNDDDSRS